MDSVLFMIQRNFITFEQCHALERCVHRGEGIARRANAILLLDKGKSGSEIAAFLYLDDNTVCGWY